MRTIKFRGKSVEDGKWVVGCLVNNLWFKSELTDNPGQPIYEIIPDIPGEDYDDWSGVEYLAVEVIPETIGQVTGHKIKDVELFEGDIVRVEEDAEGNDPEDAMNWYVVTWVKEWCMFALLHTQNEYFQYLKGGKAELDEVMYWTFPLEEHKDEEHKYFLCGNLFDNPELIINK